MSSTNNSTTTKKRANLYRLRRSIIYNLAQSLALASKRLKLASTGQPVFTDENDFKSTLALLNKLAHILPLIPKEPPPPPPPRIQVAKRGELPKNLPEPPCPICLGTHWVSFCPNKHTHDQPTLMKVMSQQSSWYAQLKQALKEQEIEQ